MDWLKALLGEELYNSVTAKLGDVKLLKDDGQMIPKHRLDQESEAKNNYKTQVEQLNGELTKVKKLLKDNEEATGKIEELQNSIKTKEADFANLSKKYALKDALREQGAKYPDLLADKFDLSKIELDGEKVKDSENIIKPYKEQYADLFGTMKMAGDPPKDGKPPMPNEYKTNPWKKETLNLTLQGKILTEKPELAARLKAEAGVKK